MPRTQAQIKSAIRGTVVSRRKRPLPGQKQFAQYPTVERYELVGEPFRIVDWEMVPAERTGWQQDSIVMHIQRGSLNGTKFTPVKEPDFSVWTGAFIKSQLENMTESDVLDEYFSCRPGSYDGKTKKATQLENSELPRYKRLNLLNKRDYSIWLDYYDNFDEELLEDDEEVEEEPEEVEDESEQPTTPQARNRQMVSSNGKSRAYQLALNDDTDDTDSDQRAINHAASRVRGEANKKSTASVAPTNASRAKIKVVGKRATYSLDEALNELGRMPRGATEFDQSTGEFIHSDGRVYDVDSHKWVAAE